MNNKTDNKEDNQTTPEFMETTTLSLRLPDANSDRLSAGAAPQR